MTMSGSVNQESALAARRARRRAEEVAAIPRWYNPWGHLACTTGTGLVVLLVAVFSLENIRPVEWLTVPLVFLFANAFEWHVHRNVLHRRFRPATLLYEKHTPLHHGIYTEHDMEMLSTQEFRLVLIPAFGVLGIVVVTAPLAIALGWLLSPNTGWLFLVTASLYMVTYELLHLTYHLPRNSFLGRRKLTGILRRHHGRHHDPRLMQKWNFNVTLPLFDWIMGTIAKDLGQDDAGHPDSPPSSPTPT